MKGYSYGHTMQKEELTEERVVLKRSVVEEVVGSGALRGQRKWNRVKVRPVS